ncbi:MAG: sulfatase-like hydrolase/transferase, partial [Pirellula sp.]
VENIDWNVGRVLQRLDQLQLRNNTIVVYFNDNGPNSFRWNACMKGRKGTLDEGGVRTPLIIQWPGVIPPNHRVEQLSGAIDITPTLCELAKIPIDNDPDHPLDGKSIAKQILNPSTPNFSRSLFTHWSGRVAMRQDQYLLDPDNALFDLISDHSQQRDLAQSEPEKVASMANDVKRWREEVLRSAQAKRPFPVGHPQRPIAILPAQDGKCKGPSVRRSDTAPNCSFFMNIRTPEDTVFWDLEFLQPGSYSVWIHYTASESAVGRKLKMTFAEDETIGSIASAHDSPLRGDKNDRVTRKSESLMKDFQIAKLGTFRPNGKQGTCELRLLEPI